MSKYLDNNGLLYVWQKIKGLLANKVDVVSGKGLSTNDYTTAEKTKLAGIETGATKVIVDSALSSTSVNAVQNKAVKAALDAKVDVVTGKGLSTNDYTTDEKNKLAGIETGANKYVLPTASATVMGGIKVGTNLSIADGVLSATDTTYEDATTSLHGLMSTADKSKLDGIAAGANKYVLPVANATTLGGVKTGTNVTIASDGTISATDTTYENATENADGLMAKEDKEKLDGIEDGANKYVLPTASTSVMGGVKVGTNLSIDTAGVLSATDTTYDPATTSTAGLMSAADKTKLNGIAEGANKYELPTASSTVLGGIKVGENLTIGSDGKLNAVQGVYTLPAATATTLGGIKVGTNLAIDANGVLSATDTTYNKATSSADGLMAKEDKAKLDQFGAASTYALKSEIVGMYRFKGSVATYDDLPTGAAVGDVYDVQANGQNYAWTGEEWDSLGEVFTIQAITNSEIDAIFAQ